MNRFLSFFLLAFSASSIFAQSTFKAGWNTYQTGMIIHEYTYTYNNNKDGIKLNLIDSTETFVSPDSMVAMIVQTLIYEKEQIKTVNFLNSDKKIIKREEYKKNILESSFEWKYDEKNRKSFEYEESKSSGNKYKRLYDYSTDKSSGDQITTETSSLNNKVEYISKSFFDKNNKKYKEVRYNDNNKDIMHVENFTYGSNGKLLHRSVYFPQFKVTKEFDEPDGTEPDKCFKSLPAGISDKVSMATRLDYLKKLISKNQSILSDPSCEHFEYKFISGTSCDVVIKTTKVNKTKNVILRFKEKQ